MMMSTWQKTATRSGVPVGLGMLQRKCSCGSNAGPSGECAECQRKRGLQSSESVAQPKLNIGRPGDRFEREADSMADRVMGTSGPGSFPAASSGGLLSGGITSLQAKPLGDESLLQRQPATGPALDEEEDALEHTDGNVREMEESNVMAKHEPGAGREPVDASDLETVRSAVSGKSAGTPLDGGTREFMESRFGHDFSQVRVHTDATADRAAGSIRARAFTQGSNIWFARGQYQPNNEAGRRLLAHELTHTIQQQGGAPALGTIQRAICPDSCVEPVGRGALCRADSVNRDNCGERGAVSEENKISHIRVLLDTRKVHLFYGGTPGTADGSKEIRDCTPNASETPTGWDKVGNKCGPDHTSWKRYNMAWFTAFSKTIYRIGFHNSQPLGAGFRSAGCVRMTCEDAKEINDNTVSNWTTIMVRNSAPGD